MDIQDVVKKHEMWLSLEDGGKLADLRHANLQGADLRRANLQGADLDFSCLPLWCGSLDVEVDKRLAVQIIYHFCRLKCNDTDIKEAQNRLLGLANQFHRVGECGIIERKVVE